MSRNLLRVVILLWLAVSLRSGFARWIDHGVPVVARAEVTATNPTGLTTVPADYDCPAAIGGSGEPRLITTIAEVVSTTDEPCTPFANQRTLLFVVDIVFAAVLFAATFVRRLGLRREASVALD